MHRCPLETVCFDFMSNKFTTIHPSDKILGAIGLISTLQMHVEMVEYPSPFIYLP